MFTLVNRRNRHIEPFITEGFKLLHLLLDGIHIVTAFNLAAIDCVDDVLHEFSPLHSAITVDVNLLEKLVTAVH